ncbi:hypothetical protein Vi05172_g11714 [Venturia inaequalis]|nr:hypothetical protein Vi05172_g11714 [Venturia inaequalis]
MHVSILTTPFLLFTLALASCRKPITSSCTSDCGYQPCEVPTPCGAGQYAKPLQSQSPGVVVKGKCVSEMRYACCTKGSF